MSTNPRLQALYDRVPVIACAGRCTEACSLIPLGPAELADLRAATGTRLRTARGADYLPGASVDMVILKPVIVGSGPLSETRCPVLVDGRCSAYEARPMICRIYGAARGMACPAGCKPERWLTRDEAYALLAEARGAGR